MQVAANRGKHAGPMLTLPVRTHSTNLQGSPQSFPLQAPDLGYASRAAAEGVFSCLDLPRTRRFEKNSNQS
jgi:hypothetical protein